MLTALRSGVRPPPCDLDLDLDLDRLDPDGGRAPR
jgi:hypothetical protein